MPCKLTLNCFWLDDWGLNAAVDLWTLEICGVDFFLVNNLLGCVSFKPPLPLHSISRASMVHDVVPRYHSVIGSLVSVSGGVTGSLKLGHKVSNDCGSLLWQFVSELIDRFWTAWRPILWHDLSVYLKWLQLIHQFWHHGFKLALRSIVSVALLQRNLQHICIGWTNIKIPWFSHL